MSSSRITLNKKKIVRWSPTQMAIKDHTEEDWSCVYLGWRTCCRREGQNFCCPGRYTELVSFLYKDSDWRLKAMNILNNLWDGRKINSSQDQGHFECNFSQGEHYTTEAEMSHGSLISERNNCL